MAKNKRVFKPISEALCSHVKIMSVADSDAIYEQMEKSETKAKELLFLSHSSKINESDTNQAKKLAIKEAIKLERLLIAEGVSEKDFFAVQKHFRSMIRATNVISNWLKGSSLSSRLDQLKVEGIELLNELYDHIKELESGGETQIAGIGKVSPGAEVAAQRDRFIKVYTDFAVLFRGTIALGDMFSDDPASIGGYNDIKSIMSSLEREDLMGDPLDYALSYADQTSSEVNPKKGFFSKFSSKRAGLTGMFKSAIANAVSGKSPGFAKLVDVNELTTYLMTKTMDQLLAIFGRFNDFVASDVDVDYLLSITKNPRSLGSLFKSIFDTFGSAGVGFGTKSR